MHKADAQIFPNLSVFHTVEALVWKLIKSKFSVTMEVVLLILFVNIWMLFPKAESCLWMVVSWYRFCFIK